MKYKMSLICGSCLMIISGLVIPSAHAAEAKKPKMKLTTSVKAQATFEENAELGVDNEGGTDNQLIELKSRLEGPITDNTSFLVEARGVKNFGEGGSIDTDTGEAIGDEDFVELRQYFVNFNNLLGAEPLSFRLGRQRIREDYGFWWNRDLDAARIFYDTDATKSFFAVGENLAEYRSTSDSFNQDDENVLRVLGESSWEWQKSHFAEGRFAFQDDHSDREDPTTLVKSDDYDSEDAQLFWMGLRLKGTLGEILEKEKNPNGPIYRFDLAGVAGEQDVLTTTPGPGVFRTVTGSTESDVSGWALDASVDIPVPVMSKSPLFHVGYAYGSGDDDSTDGKDHAFRETGLDGNSSRLNGFSSTINNYGSVLRPDLSNLHIATLGLTIPLTESMDIAGFYRYYRLAEEEGVIVGALSAPLNGTDSDLGQAIDVVLNVNLNDQFELKQDVLDRIYLKTTLGAFKAGDAYGSAADETALRGQFDFTVRF